MYILTNFQPRLSILLAELTISILVEYSNQNNLLAFYKTLPNHQHTTRISFKCNRDSRNKERSCFGTTTRSQHHTKSIVCRAHPRRGSVAHEVKLPNSSNSWTKCTRRSTKTKKMTNISRTISHAVRLRLSTLSNHPTKIKQRKHRLTSKKSLTPPISEC